MMNKDIASKNKTERIIGNVLGEKLSPTIIIFSGIHGNENAGVSAGKNVIKKIENEHIKFQGNLFIIQGNINALKKGIRYEDVDLNRIWNKENIDKIKLSSNSFNADENEQLEIYLQIKDIFKTQKGPFYFLDLHTTSSPTVPFITISDSLNNRDFSSKFPVPIVLGIEEYLDGPLLTYLNEFGHVSLGFEAGEHFDEQSVMNCEAFIWLALVYSKCVKKSELNNLVYYKKELLKSKCTNKYKFFEIDLQYIIKKDEDFKMKSGFNNFEKIKNNQKLAKSNGKDVRAAMNGRIFMPLYQELGNDGFFIITRISYFWLKTSLIVRKLNTHHFLRLLPGIEKDPYNSYTLNVNPKTAKFLTKEIFHLFGYRKQVLKDDRFHFIKRDRKITEFH